MTQVITPTSSQKGNARCPICAKPASVDANPFCSPRCQKVDLSRWFSGVYAVPGEHVPAPDSDTGENGD